jgi:hypothetical protein
MISLGGLVNQKAFGKFEMGKVISNPFATAFKPVNEAEGEDHEVSMANNSLDTIIKMATELKAKMGENEKDIPAWIQDHITNAENFISQASSNYHEYGTNEAAVPTGERIQKLNNRIKALKDKMAATKSPQQKTLIQQRLKNALQTLSNIKKDHSIKAPHRESIVKEASPCWKGYKQVGMKDKGGRQVPNCVPTESVVKEISARAPKLFVKIAAVEKKIKELLDDRKKAVVPYNNEKDPKKKEILKQILIKLTNQIKGYEKNLIQLRDMEQEYIQQMDADAELDLAAMN